MCGSISADSVTYMTFRLAVQQTVEACFVAGHCLVHALPRRLLYENSHFLDISSQHNVNVSM